MPRLVMDTSAYSRMRVGHPELVQILAAAEILLLPVTVLGELEGAFELGSRPRANRLALAEFLGGVIRERSAHDAGRRAPLWPGVRPTTASGTSGPGERHVDRGRDD